ncbi:MAG TPA: TraC family protein [Candidatus Paceibacterota bacterium]|nr:TraC family protein [Candidatus Paceibacterota bacterium]
MATTNASQQFVPIADIHDDVVILKDGQMCMVLLATSINFALKSSDEQQAILSQFQSFLNAIDFTVQIYIQSRRFDIRPYMAQLQERESYQENDLMKVQLQEYMEFIRTFTSQVDIMSKNFFVVVPYTPLHVEIAGIGKFLKANKDDATPKSDRFFEDRTQLEQRLSIVEQGLMRIGIRTSPLTTEQLIELYYHIFNPEDLSTAPKSQ